MPKDAIPRGAYQILNEIQNGDNDILHENVSLCRSDKCIISILCGFSCISNNQNE